MKKLLLSLAAAAFSFSAATAAEVVLNVNDATSIVGTDIPEKPAEGSGSGEARKFQPLESFEISGYKFETSKASGKTAPAYYFNMSTSSNTQNTVRMYSSNTITITAPAGTEMTQIVFKGSNGTANAQTTANTGTIVVPSKTEMTWTGSATAFTITYAANFRITEMTITTGSSSMETVEMPTFDPESGATFSDQIAVAINGPEGADIYYTLDGSNPTADSNKYEGVKIVFTNTTTIKAFATKEGMNPSAVASATYTKDEVMDTLADIIVAGLEGDETTEFTYGGEATVTYVNGKNMYIQDESAAILVYGEMPQTYTPGNVLTGFKGKFKNYYGTYELMATSSSFGEPVKTVEIAPEVFTIGTITPQDQNKYIIIKNVAVAFDEENESYVLKEEGSEIELYNKFNIEIPETTTMKDVEGIISYYQKKGADAPQLQIYPISFADHTVSVGTINAEEGVRVVGGSIIAPEGAQVYSISGVRVNPANPGNGVYVVRTSGKAVKVMVK